MKPARFAYLRPDTVESAVAALAEGEGEARVLAGGQSLVPMLHMRLMRPALLVDINAIPELDNISASDGGTTFGARVRYSAIETSQIVAERLPLLGAMVRRVGDRQVRNRGTMGGSLAQADPVGEIPLACLTLGATIVARSADAEREIPIEEFVLGPYTTALEPGELLVEVRFPAAPAAWSFFELTRRHNDFAVLAIAATASRGDDGEWSGFRLALAGVDDQPVLATEAARLLEGSVLEDDAIASAVEAVLAVIDPPDDVRASSDYRRHLVAVHTARVLTDLRDGEALRA